MLIDHVPLVVKELQLEISWKIPFVLKKLRLKFNRLVL